VLEKKGAGRYPLNTRLSGLSGRGAVPQDPLGRFDEAGDVTVLDSGPTYNRQVQLAMNGFSKFLMPERIVLGSKNPRDTAPLNDVEAVALGCHARNK